MEVSGHGNLGKGLGIPGYSGLGDGDFRNDSIPSQNSNIPGNGLQEMGLMEYSSQNSHPVPGSIFQTVLELRKLWECHHSMGISSRSRHPLDQESFPKNFRMNPPLAQLQEFHGPGSPQIQDSSIIPTSVSWILDFPNSWNFFPTIDSLFLVYFWWDVLPVSLKFPEELPDLMFPSIPPTWEKNPRNPRNPKSFIFFLRKKAGSWDSWRDEKWDTAWNPKKSWNSGMGWTLPSTFLIPFQPFPSLPWIRSPS